MSVTQEMAKWCAGIASGDVTPAARDWAQDCLLDWSAVTVAGSTEPLTQILADELTGESGAATIVALGKRASARDAAMVNGAMSHALDFDDVNSHMHGHPSVVIAPPALAVGEATGASGARVLTGFVAGYEVASALGVMMGDAHYDHGYHATATVGCVGAAAAAGVVLGLNEEQMHNALSLAATQASGLKCMFGTMAKPMHAGNASSGGVFAAQLAARGFEGRKHALECEQGFGEVLSPAFRPAPFRPDPSAPYEVQDNLFKFHAACYLTHSAIEATRDLVAEHGITSSDVAGITLDLPAASLRVCDIPVPRSGLDIKFSIRHVVALVVGGANTADLGLYSDANAADPVASALRAKVDINPIVPEPHRRHGANVEIRMNNGTVLKGRANVGVPATDQPHQRTRLEAKARAIATPIIGDARTGQMIDAVQKLHLAPNLSELMASIG